MCNFWNCLTKFHVVDHRLASPLLRPSSLDRRNAALKVGEVRIHLEKCEEINPKCPRIRYLDI